jgi:hypothetical protein
MLSWLSTGLIGWLVRICVPLPVLAYIAFQIHFDLTPLS